MAKEMAAAVAAVAETRGIGYQGQLVRHAHARSTEGRWPQQRLSHPLLCHATTSLLVLSRAISTTTTAIALETPGRHAVL